MHTIAVDSCAAARCKQARSDTIMGQCARLSMEHGQQVRARKLMAQVRALASMIDINMFRTCMNAVCSSCTGSRLTM